MHFQNNKYITLACMIKYGIFTCIFMMNKTNIMNKRGDFSRVFQPKENRSNHNPMLIVCERVPGGRVRFEWHKGEILFHLARFANIMGVILKFSLASLSVFEKGT